MTCQVYILERVTNTSFWARLTFQHEIKIGISRTFDKRLKDIQDDVKGQVVLLRKYEFRNYKKIEKRLHDKFEDSRFNLGQGKNAGNTEWFYMSWLELVCLYLWVWSVKHRSTRAFIFAFLIFILLAWINL